MAISKVIYKENAADTGTTWMDVTQKTVTDSSMLYGVTALKNDGTDITGTIASKTSSDLTASGDTVTVPAGYYASQATKSVAGGSATTPATTITANPSISVNSSTGLITAAASATQSVTPTVSAGYVSSGTAGTITVSGSNTSQLSTQAATTITPTESSQTAVAAGKYTTGAVTVGAISSTYIGSGVTQRDETDLTASGATVTVPSGYYAETETKSVASGSATTPATTITANPSISVSSSGLITATASATKSVTPTVSAGYVSSGTAGTITVSGSNTSQLSTQAATTITPTESAQTAVASGNYTTGAVTVGAISSTYVGSGIAQRDDTDLTASGATVTVPAGYYADTETKSVASGSAGTPTATKGAANNHSISVTPSVTNTAGYISGGTINGTAVTVSASELVSGNLAITQNGSNIDVANYSTASVDVTPNFYDSIIPSSILTSALADGKTYFGYYIPPDAANLTAILRVGATEDGGLTIDWGDGNTTTSTSTQSGINYTHTYSAIPTSGYYIISVTVNSGLVKLLGSSSNSIIGSTTDTSNYYNHTRYKWAILGDNIEQYGFSYFSGCESLLEFHAKSVGTTANANQGLLTGSLAAKAVIHSTASSVMPRCFYSSYTTSSVIIEEGVTSIGSAAFYQVYALTNITIPSTITSIGSTAFYNCYGLGEIHFSRATPPSLAASSTFGGLPTTCNIYVPYSADHSILNAYKSASNYPNPSTYTYIEE